MIELLLHFVVVIFAVCCVFSLVFLLLVVFFKELMEYRGKKHDKQLDKKLAEFINKLK